MQMKSVAFCKKKNKNKTTPKKHKKNTNKNPTKKNHKKTQWENHRETDATSLRHIYMTAHFHVLVNTFSIQYDPAVLHYYITNHCL